MKPFDGNCPQCGGECEYTSFDWHGDFVVVGLRCVECKHEFNALFDRGMVMDEARPASD